MTWWKIVLIYASVLALVLLAARFPHSWWSVTLRQSYGIRPTGPYGTFSRRDFLHGAVWALAIAIVSLMVVVVAFSIADRFPFNSRGEQIGQAYGFMFFIFTGMATLALCILLFHALRAHSYPDYPFAITAFGEIIGYSTLENVDLQGRVVWGRFVPSDTYTKAASVVEGADNESVERYVSERDALGLGVLSRAGQVISARAVRIAHFSAEGGEAACKVEVILDDVAAWQAALTEAEEMVIPGRGTDGA